MRQTDPGSVEIPVHRFIGGAGTPATDHVAVEEPLDIRIAHGPRDGRTGETVAVTMRTPGDDVSLALGFLVAEGIVRAPADVERAYPCGANAAGPRHGQNAVRVELAPHLAVDLSRLRRHTLTSSACGVCGKTSIAALETAGACRLRDAMVLPPALIHALPEFLRAAQDVFDRTGGLHAAALFDARGRPAAVGEDVGRHNAVDKVIGRQFAAGGLPAGGHVLLVSGRASFELMQKAVMAGIPALAAVGAPSSLAVELAAAFDLTLLGFVRGGRFNVYAGHHRVRTALPTAASA